MLTPHPAPWGYRADYPPFNYASLNDVHFFGALMAYSPDVVRRFKLPKIRMGEDFLFGWRSLMLGKPLLIKDKLVKYRVGSGLSSGMFRFRKARLGTIKRACEAAKAVLEDLDVANWMTLEEKGSVRLLIEKRIAYYEAWRKCLIGHSFAERLEGFNQGGEWLLPFAAPMLIRRMLLLPKWLQFPLFYVYISVVCVRRLIIGSCNKSRLHLL